MKTIHHIAILRALCGACICIAALSLYLVIITQAIRWFAS